MMLTKLSMRAMTPLKVTEELWEGVVLFVEDWT